MPRVVEKVGLVVTGLPVGGSMEAGDLVGWSSGQVVRAIGASGSPVTAIGVALAAYRTGELAAVAIQAEVSGFSAITRGQRQYLSVSAAGERQASAPSGTGQWKQTVGWGTGPDRIAFTFQDEGVSV
jgi:hypothetical protein